MTDAEEIRVRGVNHWFQGSSGGAPLHALASVDLSVRDGEFVAIVGPSGCGKTTLLNMVGGLTAPTSGEVLVGGRRPVAGAAEVSYLFARDCLLPWRTALDNVALPLEIRGVRRNVRRERAERLISAVGLDGFADSYPSQLSHGMRQRVALARTLVSEPATILMDEPFSALDAQTRLVLHDELLRLWDKHKSTVLFITHDLGEAITLADRVVVFSRRPGRIKAQFDIDLARPRRVADLQASSAYHLLYQDIWRVFESEILDDGSKGCKG